MEQIKRLQSEKRQYYQVLIDHRDFPYIRTQPEAITFLGGADGTAVYSIPGLDYVNHNDLLPYKNTSPDPFQHELFKQFFSPSSDMNSQCKYWSICVSVSVSIVKSDCCNGSQNRT
jgi:hypothetical protein